MHIACATELNSNLLPNLQILYESLKDKALEFESLIKIGSMITSFRSLIFFI